MRIAKQTLWAQLFELPDQPAMPLQARLRAAMVREIMAGHLAEGAHLPSSRDLAALTGLSRNTVTAAYRQLVDEGLLNSRPRSGVFVASGARHAVALPTADVPAPVGGSARAPNWAQRTVRSLSARPTLSKPAKWRDYPYPFVYGAHDPQLFPTEDFRECCMRSLTRAQTAHWTPDLETEDVTELVEQIRLQVLPKRGVFALAEEIVITVGAQHAFHLLAEALFREGSRVGFEEPGYPHARNSFSLREPVQVPVAIDAEGVIVDRLPALDYLFVTPSQQSPTTVTLSMDRRRSLLTWAERQGCVLIEDDYEAENLHEGAPMPALKSLDRSGHVLYVGSLSKSLAPAVRLGFIVASRELAQELRLLRHAMVRHPSAFMQHAYAVFLSLGHHESHARRVNQVMHERVLAAAQALRRHLPDFSFTLPQGGASIWVQAPAWVDGHELSTYAQHHGVLIEAGNAFFAAPPYPCPYLRLRLSSIAPQAIDEGIRRLRLAVDDLARARGHRRPV